MSIAQYNLKGNKLVTQVLNIAVNTAPRTQIDDSLWDITTLARTAFSCLCHFDRPSAEDLLPEIV